MKKVSTIIVLLLLLTGTIPVRGQYYSVNFDKETVSKMVASFNTEAATEMYYADQIAKIREHYQAAEVAAAGIFTSKFLDRKALTDLGLWTSSTENYYYRRIYHMVSAKIMPKIWTVAKMPCIGVPTSIRFVMRRRICAISLSLSSQTAV